MTYQLKAFKILQTSAMAAILYFFLALVIAVPFFLIASAFPFPISGQKFPFAALGTVFIIFIPFIYAILGFIITAIMCLFYNIVAKFMGGIAFTLEEKK